MVRIGICDDEKQQRAMMRKILLCSMELWGLECQVEEFADGDALLRYLTREPHTLDMIFLDIEMGATNGVEAARNIRRCNQDLIIIFVTGYADYVFNGYEVGALNYILKPYREEKIKEVLREALGKMDGRKEQYLTIQTGGQIRKVPVGKIRYITSQLRKAVIVTEDMELECYGKLGDLEKELPPAFVRVHQSYLVNMKYVDMVEASYLLMEGTRLPISRKYSQDAATAFTRFLIN